MTQNVTFRTTESASPLVLVVDDEASNCLLLRRTLESTGFEVVSARDGEAAMVLLESGARPSVALVDLVMPGMDGRGFIEAVRAAGHDFPALIVSGAAEAPFVADDLDCGGHLEKPYDITALLERVNTLLERAAA